MQTRRIVASLPGHDPYDIRVGEGVLDRLGQDVRSLTRIAHVVQAAIITDQNVGPLYAKRAAASLRQAGYRAHILTIPAGEATKTIDVASELWQALAQLGCTRDSTIVSLGGGVVGDIAGFVGATYMRGVPVIHVPTTLLAMIDASVGGKTALDLPQGKNLIGAFKQPEYVCADLTVLSTLPSEQWASGLAELAKMAIITSDEFFFWLCDHASDLADGDAACSEHADVVAEALTRAISAKVDVVAQDEFDVKGVRALLNYGHTLGHALEVLSGYAVPHGLAVAEGMRFAVRLACDVCGTSLDVVKAQDDLLDALKIPAVPLTPTANKLLASMHADKKATAQKIRFVLPEDIARLGLYEVDDETLSTHLKAWVSQRRPKRTTGRRTSKTAEDTADKEPKKTSSRSRTKPKAAKQEPKEAQPTETRKRRTQRKA
ncbi:MAG: 3-dehydroquinate synthase [Eggerthellaceae bacterium]|nr:3-dehydroquinate synthase [Eggerthellaceae bacterium]